MTTAAAAPTPWPDPLEIVLEPRAWLALVWPGIQVVLGAIHLSMLCAGYGFALSFVPLVIGLPMLSLVTRAAWWVAEVEARLVSALAMVPSGPAQELPPANGFLLGLGELMSMGSAWTRPLGLLMTLPLGGIGLGLVTGFFSISTAFFLGGLSGAFGWLQVSFDGWVLPPARGAVQAVWILGGLVGMLGTLHLAFAWLRLHARFWQALR